MSVDATSVDDGRQPTSTSTPLPGSRWTQGHVPGEVGVWLFVFADMVVFGIFFGVFLVARGDDPQLFAASRQDANTGLGVLNMIVLLTSSLLVAKGVHATRSGARARGSRLFGLGAVLGCVFLAVKVIEYAQKFSHGIDPATNDYFFYFFVFTGIHAVHVILGVAVLLVLRFLTKRPEPSTFELRTVESGATFWHMVDLLWVVLFPLLYLAS